MRVLVYVDGRKVVDAPYPVDEYAKAPQRTEEVRVLFVEDEAYGSDRVKAWATGTVKE